jgi:glutamine synthetase
LKKLKLVFDGSSTKQAEAVPLIVYWYSQLSDPTRINGYLVMTEVMHADGTPHSSNGRATIDDDGDFFSLDLNKSISLWILKHCCHRISYGGYPAPQMYYCSVGGKIHGRALVEEHADLCIAAGN